MGEPYGTPPLGRGGGGFSFRLPSLGEGRGWVGNMTHIAFWSG